MVNFLLKTVVKVIAACIQRAALFTVLFAVFSVQGAPSPKIEVLKQLIHQTDDIRTQNPQLARSNTNRLLDSFELLTEEEQEFVKYLDAYLDLVIDGDYELGFKKLARLANNATSLNVRTRSLLAMANVQSILRQYESAFEYMHRANSLIPKLSDQTTKDINYFVSGFLYEAAGHFEGAVDYGTELYKNSLSARSRCLGGQLLLQVAKSGYSAVEVEPLLSSAGELCLRADEPLMAAISRAWAAFYYINNQRWMEALHVLDVPDSDLISQNYPFRAAVVNILRARIHWHFLRPKKARQLVEAGLKMMPKNSDSEFEAMAYKILSEIESWDGNHSKALELHKKYAKADKAHLDEIKMRSVAFQLAKLRITQKDQLIHDLSGKNRTLTMERAFYDTDSIGFQLAIIVVGFLSLFAIFYGLYVKKNHVRLTALARFDGLTGAATKHYFTERAEGHLGSFIKVPGQLSLVMLDFDHFKEINDNYGHRVGDWVLQTAIKTCNNLLRSSDLIGRVGGEEFAIILPRCDQEQACATAERCRQAIEAIDTSLTSFKFKVTASFGVTTASISGLDLNHMLNDADRALYHVKHTGRNKVQVYGAQLYHKGDEEWRPPEEIAKLLTPEPKTNFPPLEW